MTPVDLELINADIIAAEIGLKNFEGEALSGNPYMLSIAAFHSVQAIENSLKAIISKEGHMNEEMLHSHNISELLVEAENVRPDILREYESIGTYADMFASSDELRDERRVIGKKQAEEIYSVAKKLYYQLEKEYCRKTGMTTDEVHRLAEEQYESLPKLELEFQDEKVES